MAKVNDKWIMFLVRVEGAAYHQFHKKVSENGQTKAKVIRILINGYLEGNLPKRIGRDTA